MGTLSKRIWSISHNNFFLLFNSTKHDPCNIIWISTSGKNLSDLIIKLHKTITFYVMQNLGYVYTTYLTTLILICMCCGIPSHVSWIDRVQYPIGCKVTVSSSFAMKSCSQHTKTGKLVNIQTKTWVLDVHKKFFSAAAVVKHTIVPYNFSELVMKVKTYKASVQVQSKKYKVFFLSLCNTVLHSIIKSVGLHSIQYNREKKIKEQHKQLLHVYRYTDLAPEI